MMVGEEEKREIENKCTRHRECQSACLKLYDIYVSERIYNMREILIYRENHVAGLSINYVYINGKLGV